MSVSEKVAYLRGLMEGLDIDDDSKEGKLFSAIVDTLDEIASEISDMEEDFEDLSDYVEEIDEDLGDVEGFVYGDDDCDCCCDDDCDCDCVEIHCPACEEDVCIDLDCIDDDGVCQCPNCGADIEFEILDEDEPTEE
ncbi:MAG: hypothetical protein PUF31_01485 [Oscillospiraceae bacterium]|nr:hypothetical protein [Oscillospiraceae bacterium]MDD6526481.1 hypothetical protein [Oscillospiraceae bacterium]